MAELQWFRFYNEALNDPKVQGLPAELFRVWINVLCVANEENDWGFLPSLDDLAFKLRLTLEETETALDDLFRRNLIEKSGRKLTPHNWNRRQYQSDSSTERSRKSRERRRSATNATLHATLQSVANDPTGNVAATPRARTETDTEAETDADARARETHAPAREDDPILGNAHYPSPEPRMVGKQPMPTDWGPTAETISYGTAKVGLSLDETNAALEQFRLHQLASGKTNADWQSAAQYWLSQQPRFQTPAGNGNGRHIENRDNVIKHGEDFDAF